MLQLKAFGTEERLFSWWAFLACFPGGLWRAEALLHCIACCGITWFGIHLPGIHSRDQRAKPKLAGLPVNRHHAGTARGAAWRWTLPRWAPGVSGLGCMRRVAAATAAAAWRGAEAVASRISVCLPSRSLACIQVTLPMSHPCAPHCFPAASPRRPSTSCTPDVLSTLTSSLAT